MKRILIIIFAIAWLTACTNNDEMMRDRAAELCQYIPDHELNERSKDFMTADFHAVLDTLFNHLPEHEAMDHEWLYYFVTGNGGTIADFEVDTVEQTDATHAIATIKVRQKWEDGSFDENSDIETHHLMMEKENGKWLIADFDGHKQDCINHIAVNRREQAIRKAMNTYLAEKVGEHYLKGEYCFPSVAVVAEETCEDTTQTRVWCDTWIFWYQISGDTLKTVSGGNHSGLMTLRQKGKNFTVTAFEETADGAGNEASAHRIFGPHYDVYHNIHSNSDVGEEIRKEQLKEHIRQNGLTIRYYQDFGWDAIKL